MVMSLCCQVTRAMMEYYILVVSHLVEIVNKLLKKSIVDSKLEPRSSVHHLCSVDRMRSRRKIPIVIRCSALGD